MNLSPTFWTKLLDIPVNHGYMVSKGIEFKEGKKNTNVREEYMVSKGFEFLIVLGICSN